MGMERFLAKAKRKDNGQWVEGFIFLHNDNWCIGDMSEPLYPNDHSELIGENQTWFVIDTTTLCQYTGRTDKDGNKIWEHDNVHVFYTDGEDDMDEIVEVSLTKDGYSPFNWEYECDGCDLRCEILSIKVIGNAFD